MMYVIDISSFYVMCRSWAVQIGVQYKGRVIYEIQEGRYRITFDNIKFYEPDNI